MTRAAGASEARGEGGRYAGIDYTDRQRDALGGTPGICRALNPQRTFMCDLDAGHEGDHRGFELPTVDAS